MRFLEFWIPNILMCLNFSAQWDSYQSSTDSITVRLSFQVDFVKYQFLYGKIPDWIKEVVRFFFGPVRVSDPVRGPDFVKYQFLYRKIPDRTKKVGTDQLWSGKSGPRTGPTAFRTRNPDHGPDQKNSGPETRTTDRTKKNPDQKSGPRTGPDQLRTVGPHSHDY